MQFGTLNYLMVVKENVNYKLTTEFSALPKEYSLGELASQMTANNKVLHNQYVNQSLLKNAVALAKVIFRPVFLLPEGRLLVAHAMITRPVARAGLIMSIFMGILL